MKKVVFIIRILVVCTLISSFGVIPQLFASQFNALDRDAVIESAKSINQQQYPNAEVVHVDQQSWVHYLSDGTYVQWYEAYVKILTEKGRRSYTSVTSSFTIPYNTTIFTLVEVIRSDGSILDVDIEKNSRVMVEQSQMEANIYNPNDKLLRVTIPEVNVGDMVHFIMFDEFVKARMPGTFSDIVTLESTDPIKRSTHIIVAPKEKPLESIALKAEIPGTITHSTRPEDDEIVYTWVARDVPRAFEEPQMPKFYTQAQRLLVSTIPDWETISRWYWNLSKPHIERTTPQMEQTVKVLTAGIEDSTKKIETIFQWVSQGIRYLGITAEKDAPGYEPHPVDMTFERRSGVCRDKAALLVSMLRLAGFEAFPVLIMNGPKKDAEVPQPFFNHAISCVRHPDGTYLLMDATDESTKELFPAYLNNQSYLVATPEGETLLTSPISPAEENMMRIETTGSLDAAGDLNAVSRLRFEGINDNAYRGYFSRLSPEERKLYFERAIKGIAPGSILTAYEILPADMLDTTRNLTVNISFRVKDFRAQGSDAVMLPLMRIGRSIGVANFLTGKMSLKERRYPYVTDVTCGIEESLRLDLGESVGESLSLPEFVDVDNAGATWKRRISVKEGTLISENTFALKLPEYSPKEYHDLKQTLKKIEADSRKMPIFKPSAQAAAHLQQPWYAAYKPDAVILDEIDEFDVKDASTWIETKYVKMKVLTYAGKKNYSDLHVRYNPSWETVDIVSAVVTSPSGEETAIEDKEMNIMDALWAADAPRYPASKVLVVSLPGVEEGSIIEYTLKRTKTERLGFSINGEFCMSDMARVVHERGASRNIFSIDGVLRSFEPIQKKTLRIKVPKGMDLNISGIGAEEGLFAAATCPAPAQISKDTYTENGKVIHEFIAGNVTPVIEEESLPPWYSFNPVIFASSGDWERYAKEVNKVLTKAASSQEKTEERTRRLLKDDYSDHMKITTIRDYVAKNIKYIDVALGDMPLTNISTADKTLTDGYGNTADKAIVVFTMLRAAGFDPEFVLASWVPPVAGLYGPLHNHPLDQWFTDVLVRIKQDNRYIYLNDTDQYAALGSTKNAGRQGLVLKSGTFETIENASDELDDRRDQTIAIELSDSGDAIIRKTGRVYGRHYASFNKQFSEMPPEERSRHYQKIVSSISQAAVALGEYKTDYESYPGIEEFSVQAQAYATRQENYLYLNLSGFLKTLDGVFGDARKNPLYRGESGRDEISVEVLFPDGVKAVQLVPPDKMTIPLAHAAGQISLETRLVYEAQGTRIKGLELRENIDLDPAVLLPEEYPQLLEANRILSHPRSRMILIEFE